MQEDAVLVANAGASFKNQGDQMRRGYTCNNQGDNMNKRWLNNL